MTTFRNHSICGFLWENYLTNNYTLKNYLAAEPQLRHNFFFPGPSAGPDLIFFIHFHDGTSIPVISEN
ncbi:16442_t:CDS:2 [Entrophospora sp. SA101]|nr:16442_t:CDS:2 [Entrophospora sp. SA101]